MDKHNNHQDDFMSFLQSHDPAYIPAERLARLHTKVWQKINNSRNCETRQPSLSALSGTGKIHATWQTYLPDISRSFTMSAFALLLIGFFLGQGIAPVSTQTTTSATNMNNEQLFTIAMFGSPWQVVMIENEE
jgi:hypothetical protein